MRQDIADVRPSEPRSTRERADRPHCRSWCGLCPVPGSLLPTTVIAERPWRGTLDRLGALGRMWTPGGMTRSYGRDRPTWPSTS